MIGFSKNRWLLVTIGHYLTLFFVGLLNHYISPSGIQIYILGMLISFSSMELNYRQGLLSIAPIGLLIDSKSPLPFGYAFFTCLVLFTVAQALRSRIRREITAYSLATSIILNLVAYFVFTFGALRTFSAEAVHFLPILLNLFANTIVVLLLNRIFFETQIGVLETFGINLAEEQREAR